MTWNDIKNMCLDLFYADKLSDQEEQEYSNKFQRLANQGLVSIANSVKPKIATYKCRVYAKKQHLYLQKEYPLFVVTTLKNVNSIAEMEDVGGYLYNEEIYYKDETTIYKKTDDSEYEPANIVPMDNNMLLDINGVKYGTHDWKIYSDSDERFEHENLFAIGEEVTMPEDFISFGNMTGKCETTVIDPYYNTQEIKEEVYTPDHYIKRNAIYFDKPGVYTVHYNALWEEITDDYTKYADSGKELPQDKSVLSILPQYIAFNILAQDDIQRSAILKNDYEVLLSRLDTSVQYDTEDYKSSKGWY